MWAGLAAGGVLHLQPRGHWELVDVEATSTVVEAAQGDVRLEGETMVVDSGQWTVDSEGLWARRSGVRSGGFTWTGWKGEGWVKPMCPVIPS